MLEVYESPFVPFHLAFKDFTFNNRIITSLMAGEQREVKLRFRITKPKAGIAFRCYDQFSDPGLSVFEQYDRHNTGFSWER